MKHFFFLTFLLASCAILHGAKPNVLIILTDDLGYGDPQCYNPERGKIKTPRMDQLAREGMRFTDGHSSSGVCSPSRYSLLTGRYHWRTSLQSGIVEYMGAPLIAPDRITIASLAKKQGYHTGCIGKWHLGWDWGIREDQRELFNPVKKQGVAVTDAHRKAWQEVYSRTLTNGPTTRGFDEYFGTDVPNQPPYCFIKNDRTVGIPSEFLPPENFNGVLASIAGPALKDWKLENILPTLANHAAQFIKTQAEAKQPFLLYLPLTAPHTPIAVTKAWQGKSGLGAYGDFMMQTDAIVGRVLDALKDNGVADNTLVFFTSDNGCAPHGWKTTEPLGHFPSGPLRDHKASVYEGGHRVPFIARWPGVVKPDSVCQQYAQQADFLATLADILGVKLPDNAGEDSVSLLPLLKGEDKPVRTHAINTAGSGVPSLREGPWKLIVNGNRAQLYNLDNDIGETNDLAGKQRERVKAMSAQLEKFIIEGRTTRGAPQKNDVEVKRYVPANATVAK